MLQSKRPPAQQLTWLCPPWLPQQKMWYVWSAAHAALGPSHLPMMYAGAKLCRMCSIAEPCWRCTGNSNLHFSRLRPQPQSSLCRRSLHVPQTASAAPACQPCSAHSQDTAGVCTRASASTNLLSNLLGGFLQLMARTRQPVSCTGHAVGAR